MTTLALIVREFVGLFIDDGSLAMAILVLVGAVAILLKVGILSGMIGGGLLFFGLCAILAENLWRSAARLRRP